MGKGLFLHLQLNESISSPNGDHVGSFHLAAALAGGFDRLHPEDPATPKRHCGGY